MVSKAERADPDPSNLMAPPVDPKKLKAMMVNPWAADMLGKNLEMLKLAKKQKEEEE
jgi:hypothetical protein